MASCGEQGASLPRVVCVCVSEAIPGYPHFLAVHQCLGGCCTQQKHRQQNEAHKYWVLLLFTYCQFFACVCVCLCRRVSMCYAAPWLASKSRFWQIIHRRGGWQAKWGLSERLTKAQGGEIFEKRHERSWLKKSECLWDHFGVFELLTSFALGAFNHCFAASAPLPMHF